MKINTNKIINFKYITVNKIAKIQGIVPWILICRVHYGPNLYTIP